MIGWLSFAVEVLILLLQLLILRRLDGRGIDVPVDLTVEVPAEVHRGEREISPGWEQPPTADPADERPCAQVTVAPAAQIHPCGGELSSGWDHGR